MAVQTQEKPVLFYLGDDCSALIIGSDVLGTVYSGTGGRYQYLGERDMAFATFNEMPTIAELMALHAK